MGICGGMLRPRERIIDTARDLFRRHGIRGVGVDAIAEAAGTNKMTLYRHFGSKDDLIVAYLRDVARSVDEIWDSFEVLYAGDPMAQLRAWVRKGAECAAGSERGCDFANVAVELADSDHPAREVIEQFKRAQRDRLAGLCRAARIGQADLLADTLYLLLEGARVSRQSAGAEGPCARFIGMADAIIASFAAQGQAVVAQPPAARPGALPRVASPRLGPGDAIGVATADSL